MPTVFLKLFANFGPKMTNSTMLGLVTSLKMMMLVVGVLNFTINAPFSGNHNVRCRFVFES